MTVQCNFKKQEVWKVIGEAYWSDEYKDSVANVIEHKGNRCLLKGGAGEVYLCDEEDCIFFKKEDSK